MKSLVPTCTKTERTLYGNFGHTITQSQIVLENWVMIRFCAEGLGGDWLKPYLRPEDKPKEKRSHHDDLPLMRFLFLHYFKPGRVDEFVQKMEDCFYIRMRLIRDFFIEEGVDLKSYSGMNKVSRELGQILDILDVMRAALEIIRVNLYRDLGVVTDDNEGTVGLPELRNQALSYFEVK